MALHYLIALFQILLPIVNSAPPAGSSSPSIVGCQSNWDSNTSVSATLTVTGGSDHALVTGNFYNAGGNGAGFTTITVSDSKNAGNYSNVDASQYGTAYIVGQSHYYLGVAAGSTVVTQTTGVTRSQAIMVCEVAGVSALGSHGNASTTTTSPLSVSLTTTQASSVLLGFGAAYDSSGFSAGSPTGMALLANTANGVLGQFVQAEGVAGPGSVTSVTMAHSSVTDGFSVSASEWQH